MGANNAILEYFKYSYSTALLAFSVVLVLACIFTGQSSAQELGIPPLLAGALFGLLVAWLAVMEGGQGCLVGLKPIPKSRYKQSHPLTHWSCSIAHEGDNLERFIVGRQFLVVLVIFLINMVGEASNGADPLHLPSIWNLIFLQNGVAMMITTINIGQLPAQVNASVAMLDFVQNYAMVATTYISLWIEASGLLHVVYLLQYGFAILTGKTQPSSSQEKTGFQRLWFGLKVTISLAILALALAVTIEALREGKSGMYEGVSPAVSIVIFFLLLGLVGLMEGMQIAAFASLNTTEEELLEHSTMAHKNCSLMFDGDNFQSFLIGRQIFVAALMFVVAKIATIRIPEGESNIFNVPDGVQAFLNTGLLGAVVLTVLGSLIWRVVASSYPLLFLSNPLVYIILRACFLLEATGICSASWLIALAMKSVFGLKSDDEYLGQDDDEEEIENALAQLPMARDVTRASFASRRMQVKRASLVSVSGSSSRRASLFASSRRFSRLSVVRLSSMEHHSDRSDNTDVKTQAELLRDSYVASARLSAIISPEDLGALMDEIGNDYGDSPKTDVENYGSCQIELGGNDSKLYRLEKFDDEFD